MRPSRTWPAAAALVVVALLAPGAAGQQTIQIDRELLSTPEVDHARERITFSEGTSEREQARELAISWHQGVQEGNTADAADLLPEIQALLAEPGYKDTRLLLGSFVAMGKEWMLTDEWSKAERAFDAAILLDPDHGAAHLALGELAWRRDGGMAGAVGVVAGVVQATKAGLSSNRGQLRAFANAVLVLALGAAVAAGGFALVLAVKYNRLVRHGAQESLADRVPEGIDRVLAWLLVLLPLVLFLSPAWWAIYWLVLLQPYGTAGERRLAVLALVVLALAPPVVTAVSELSALQTDPVVRAIEALEEQDVTPEVLDQVESLAADGPDSTRLLLALLYAEMRQPDQALAVYHQLLQENPRHARALVNRGNIHFRRGDRQSAMVDYKAAVDADRQMVLAWRNGSIAYFQDLKTAEANEWQREAQSLDAGAVRRWNDQVGDATVVDAGLTASESVRMMLAENPGIGRRLMLALLSPVTIGALLGVLVVAIRSRRGVRALEASACEKCGRAFCTRCHAAARSSAYCTQCVHLYVKKDGVSPVVRTAKLREVEKWSAINSIAIRAFNILLPGAGSIYANRIVMGTVLLFTWAAAVVALLIPTRMVVDQHRMGHSDLTMLFGFELAVLVIVYLVALTQSLRHST